MGNPPSALLDTMSVTDGMRGLSSAATNNEVINDVFITVAIIFTVYYAFELLALILAAILDFGAAVSQGFRNGFTFIHQHIPTLQTARNTPQHLFNSGTRIYSSVENAYTLTAWLHRTLSTPTTQSITATTLVLPHQGTLVLIRGLPSDISAPELRRYLEITLWERSISQLRAQLPISQRTPAAIPAANNRNMEKMRTSGRGLWNGTCVGAGSSGASTPDTSGIHTPSSGSSVTGASDVDVDEQAAVASEGRSSSAIEGADENVAK